MKFTSYHEYITYIQELLRTIMTYNNGMGFIISLIKIRLFPVQGENESQKLNST